MWTSTRMRPERPGRRLGLIAAIGALVATVIPPALASFPSGAHSSDPYDYSQLHLPPGGGACAPLAAGQARPAGSALPSTFDCRASSLLTDYAAQSGEPDYDPLVANNPQELMGRKGPGTNRAWETTTGRPDTVIAVLDSGIEWDTPELVNKVWLNWRSLPLPCHAATAPACGPRRFGTSMRQYDANRDGMFNVADYAHDPRLSPANHSYLTPEDLIRAFSDGIDHSRSGYVNDIAGWDFYQRDNDPADDVTYGHGTGEARDSSAEVTKQLTQCPNCMFMPLRVGDSFIANINNFAEAVVFAVDHGASVIQEALGTVNHTAFAQQAADYAYNHGVLVVASAADEEAGHHNYPAALNHTMVVNSVTHPVDQGGVVIQHPASYLTFNGCTNFGGYIWVTVESNSCSSAATGNAAGIAGLLYSAAANAIHHGTLAPRTGTDGRPLSAEEAKQLFRLSADDVDFSTPRPPFGPPNNFLTTLPASIRYATTAGWDQITGFGRLNSATLVQLVSAGRVPPEADVTGPSWWDTLDTRGTVPIVGRVAAPRAASYTYQVEFAPGVQPPLWPLADHWTVVAGGAGTAAKAGVLAHLDLAAVRAAIDAAPPVYTPATDPTSRDMPERDAFRVRVVVHANGSNEPIDTAIEQRQYYSHHDPLLVPGWPKHLGADGAGSAAFADLEGTGHNNLVIADGNGWVHAYRPDGTEAPGWPVHTGPIPLPTIGGNAFARHALSPVVYSPVLLGSPTIADLDGTGWPSVAVADTDGSLYVWDHTGRPRAGFPVHTNPAYSHDPGCQLAIGTACDHFTAHPVRDHINTVDRAFASQPAAGRIDPAHPGLDLVVGAMDGHVYAFHGDGTPVPGWPVLLRDPTKVSSVDATSHRVTFRADANPLYGRQVLAGVTIGDLLGRGTPQVAVNVDEEYAETPNMSLRDPTLQAFNLVSRTGNTRTYLLWPDGTHHSPPAGAHIVPNLGNMAYVPGWPVKIAMLETELLPDVGSGSDGAPVMATLNGRNVIGTASIAGPPYLLNPDGSSYYGNGPDGRYLTMGTNPLEFKNPTATDGPSIAALGGGVFGHLAGPTSPLSWAAGAVGLRRALDVVLPDQQIGRESHVDSWNAATGTFDLGFPAQMNDLQFFTTPAIADVDGSGSASVLQGSSVNDLRAYRVGGIVPAGWPKFTGGWVVSTPTIGAFTSSDPSGTVDVAVMTREGILFVWHAAGAICQAAQWPKYQHDLWNSGSFGTDASPPGALRDVRVDGSTVRFLASGDNAYCGRADHYRVTVDGRPLVSQVLPAPGVAGAPQSITIEPGSHQVVLQAVDAAGNLGIPASVLVGRPAG